MSVIVSAQRLGSTRWSDVRQRRSSAILSALGAALSNPMLPFNDKEEYPATPIVTGKSTNVRFPMSSPNYNASAFRTVWGEDGGITQKKNRWGCKTLGDAHGVTPQHRVVYL